MDPMSAGPDGPGMTFDMPQLVNQPPQIFGAYSSDGSPIPPVLNGSVFGDPNDASFDDLNDPKRRRIARVGRDRMKGITSVG